MRAGFFKICLIVAITVALVGSAFTQTGRRQSSPPPQKKQTAPVRTQPSQEAAPEPTPPGEEPEVVKVDTDLVTVPLIAATTEGNFVPDLRQEEISISEDGVKQEVAFFATVNTPFHVVLMLDTSASTQQKLGLIRNAAIAFVEQLQAGDRVKVISFDDTVRDLNEFTNNRTTLRNAINKTQPGRGTKVYDAFELALGSIRPIQGRKAIVLFSDGMDWHSDRATFDGNLRWLDEEEVVIYPIRYETRAETERLAREQAAEQGSGLPTLDNIRRQPSGTTAPTFPSDDPESSPTVNYPGRNGSLGIPDILRKKREVERDRDRDQNGTGNPRPDRLPSSLPPSSRSDESTFPRRGSRPRIDDSISAMLDQAYMKADSYLTELATRSGGRIVRADTLASLPDAFAQIAAELRTQYTVGYYPTNRGRDGKYRRIKISTSRKNLHVRARPGYRAQG